MDEIEKLTKEMQQINALPVAHYEVQITDLDTGLLLRADQSMEMRINSTKGGVAVLLTKLRAYRLIKGSPLARCEQLRLKVELIGNQDQAARLPSMAQQIIERLAAGLEDQQAAIYAVGTNGGAAPGQR
jgi:hypothetical protein